MVNVTLRDAVEGAARRLAAVPELTAAAARDAEWLLLARLRLGRAELRAHGDRLLRAEELAWYEAAVARRLRSEPVQYIVGEQEFFGLAMQVSPAVLIPRPETELLVEAVLARLPEGGAMRVLDVGTGSGAIAVALAVHRPLATVTAVDLSVQALAVARENARAHGVEERVRFVESDLLAGVAGVRFDCVVSNPPYVPENDRDALHPQVREYEPGLALFGGDDGLAVYRRLIPQAERALGSGGLLAMELGFGQRAVVAVMLVEWGEVSFLDDLQGIPRVVLARRR